MMAIFRIRPYWLANQIWGQRAPGCMLSNQKICSGNFWLAGGVVSPNLGVEPSGSTGL